MNATRRTLIGAMLAAPLVANAAPSMGGGSGYASVALAPHADDEVIRLSGYITHMADRGDSVALVTATDGAATSVRTRLGLTKPEVTRWRDREQAAAWDWLTDGRGDAPIRLGFPDGAAVRASIRNALREQLGSMSGAPEIYVASARPSDPAAYVPGPGAGDRHVDHVACVQAALDLANEGVTVRFARHPAMSHISGTHTYDTTDKQWYRVQGAVAAYAVIGQRSVPETFAHVVRTRGRSVITR